jgi:hypothetical protein
LKKTYSSNECGTIHFTARASARKLKLKSQLKGNSERGKERINLKNLPSKGLYSYPLWKLFFIMEMSGE